MLSIHNWCLLKTFWNELLAELLLLFSSSGNTMSFDLCVNNIFFSEWTSTYLIFFFSLFRPYSVNTSLWIKKRVGVGEETQCITSFWNTSLSGSKNNDSFKVTQCTFLPYSDEWIIPGYCVCTEKIRLVYHSQNTILLIKFWHQIGNWNSIRQICNITTCLNTL